MAHLNTAAAAVHFCRRRTNLCLPLLCVGRLLAVREVTERETERKAEKKRRRAPYAREDWSGSGKPVVQCHGQLDILWSLGSLVAFQAMVSIATIGLYIAYALPIFFRVTLARRSFVPGPFNLGKYSIFVGWVAVLWVATIAVLFSLPVAYPITKDTLNYTPVAVGGVVFVTVSSWILSARHWFKGPITNINT
ncbi:hypothetical protein EJ110_NYTH51963 [Nymphaea thermarum]|nr:hypothetical protein EJ110_NYTH51963 [Nymphaea thermarum]